MKAELKKQVIFLRKKGLSYNEIREKVVVSKSTLSLWLRGVRLNSKQTERIKKKEEANREEFKKWNNSQWKNNRENATRRAVKGGENCQKLHGASIQTNMIKANLAYRKDEIPIKKKLEKYYQTTFIKERIGNFYHDFVNEDYLIEHTIDEGKGLTEAILRLSKVPSTDKRKRILITKCKNVGRIRQQRCQNNKIALMDILEFY